MKLAGLIVLLVGSVAVGQATQPSTAPATQPTTAESIPAWEARYRDRAKFESQKRLADTRKRLAELRKELPRGHATLKRLAEEIAAQKVEEPWAELSLEFPEMDACGRLVRSDLVAVNKLDGETAVVMWRLLAATGEVNPLGLDVIKPVPMRKYFVLGKIGGEIELSQPIALDPKQLFRFVGRHKVEDNNHWRLEPITLPVR